MCHGFLKNSLKKEETYTWWFYLRYNTFSITTCPCMCSPFSPPHSTMPLEDNFICDSESTLWIASSKICLCFFSFNYVIVIYDKEKELFTSLIFPLGSYTSWDGVRSISGRGVLGTRERWSDSHPRATNTLLKAQKVQLSKTMLE